MLKRLFLNLKGLSDVNVASLTKKEYGSVVQFFEILMKSLELHISTLSSIHFLEIFVLL